MNCKSIYVARHSRLKYLVCTGVIFALGLVIGCGGGGGGGTSSGSQPILGGDAAAAAVGIGGVQATVAGQVPVMILQQFMASNPAVADSIFFAKDRGPTFVPALNLYAVASLKTLSTGLKEEIDYYTDSAATRSAGSVYTDPLPAKVTYPEVLTIIGSITKGNMPMQFLAGMTILDSRGANKLTGSVVINPASKNSMAVNFDPHFQVDDSGTPTSDSQITVSYSNIAATLSNLSGSSLGTMNADANVTYIFGSQKFTGTGAATINIPNGAFTINLAGTMGQLAAAATGSSSLSLTLPSGARKLVANPVAFGLSTLSTGSGGGGTGTGITGGSSGSTGATSGSGGSTGSFQNPVTIAGFGSGGAINQVLGNGMMVGVSGSTPSFWQSPTSNPIALPLASGAQAGTAYGVCDNGGLVTVVGSCSVNGTTVPCFWQKLNSTVATSFSLSNLSLGTYGTSGEGLAIQPNGGEIVGYIVTGNNVQTPFVWVNGNPCPLNAPGQPTGYKLIGVDSAGDILGQGSDTGAPLPGVFTAVAISGGQASATFLPLTGLNGEANNVLTALRISPTGVIVGTSTTTSYYWAKTNSFAPMAFKQFSGTPSYAEAISDDGTEATGIIEPSPSSQNYDLGYWNTLTGSPQDVTKAVGGLSKYNLIGVGVLSDKSIIALDEDFSSTSGQSYLYLQSK